MSNVIPEKYADLFQKRAFASLGTSCRRTAAGYARVCDSRSACDLQLRRDAERQERAPRSRVRCDHRSRQSYRYLESRYRGRDHRRWRHPISTRWRKIYGVDKYPTRNRESRVLYKIRRAHDRDGLVASAPVFLVTFLRGPTLDLAAFVLEGRVERPSSSAGGRYGSGEESRWLHAHFMDAQAIMFRRSRW